MKNDNPPHNRRKSARVRRVLGWVVLEFIAIQAALVLFVGLDWKSLRDPEYDAKFSKLRERLAEHPQRPLILVLGSSRSVTGICPEMCLPDVPNERSPLVFNFALTGAGPRQHLVLLRRLLAEGIRPAGVLVEVLPALLCQSGTHNEDVALKRRHMQAEESAIRRQLPDQVRYPAIPPATEWLTYWYTSRFRMLRQFAPAWVELEPPQTKKFTRYGPFGWLPFANGAKTATAEQYQKGLEQSRKVYEHWLAHWEVSDVADEALRELLATCQRERMGVAVYLMPEGSPFRAWYRPEVRTDLNSYLTRICHDHDAMRLDATLWNADEDFWDGHHLLADGATRFSQRFGKELLEPFTSKIVSPEILSQQPTSQRR